VAVDCFVSGISLVLYRIATFAYIALLFHTKFEDVPLELDPQAV